MSDTLPTPPADISDAQAAYLLAYATDRLARAMVAQPQPMAPPRPAPPAPPAPVLHPVAAIVAKLTTPRGIRNNNPGNVDKSKVKWQGEVVPGSDARFCQFSDMAHGVRAAAVTLLAYEKHDGCTTIHDYIARWAPGKENNTAAYIAAVALDCGSSATTPFKLAGTYGELSHLCAAIFRHENGGDYVSAADLASGMALALKE